MAVAHLGLGSPAPTFPSYSLPAPPFPPSLPPVWSACALLLSPRNIWMQEQVHAASEAHLSSSEMSVLISGLVILREIRETQRDIHSCLTGFHL